MGRASINDRVAQLPVLRENLKRSLAVADDEKFLEMVWCANAMQSGRADDGRAFFRDATPLVETSNPFSTGAIFPWELETIANELLAADKHAYFRNFDCHSWGALTGLIRHLRALEQAEYVASRVPGEVMREFGRLGARQFDWQRGFLTIPELYRSAFIYGQGECAEYMKESGGISPVDFSLVGFSLISVFTSHPRIRHANDLELLNAIGLSKATISCAINKLARPLEEIKTEAFELRAEGSDIAYAPSVLRRYPCILIGHRMRHMIAPLPDLIAARITSGLFYDVVGGEGHLRAEIGRRFEAYCLSLVEAMLPTPTFLPEWPYKTSKGRFDATDIVMLSDNQEICLAIECKATRMDIGARFGRDPGSARGYEEIVKGIVQTWRFFAHCRQGLTHKHVADDAIGLILTLDEWFAGRGELLNDLLIQAHEKADQSSSEITAGDRRPIAFCSISDLEWVLQTATQQTLLAALALAAGEKRGWILSSLHAELDAERSPPKDYPFEGDLEKLLPWFAKIKELGEEASVY